MTQHQTTLANGLRIITAEMPDSLSVSASIVVGTGSRYEQFDINGGVSHFLEHLLFKGTKNYPTAEDIGLAVDAVGGMNNAYTTEDVTNYFIKVPARHSKLPLKILADMVAAPLLDPEEIDRERPVIIEEMNVYRDDPARFVSTLIPHLLFPNNPLQNDVAGSDEVIRRIPLQEVRKHIDSYYTPENMVVSVAGKVKHEAVVAQTEQLLGGLSRGKNPKFTAVGPDLAEEITIQLQKDTAQAHFVVAARAFAYGDRKEVVTRVISSILGKGSSSRLYMNVRERQGLAYTVTSETASFADTGLIDVYAGVNLDKMDLALESVMHELARICIEPVPAAELAKSKEQLSAVLEMAAESNLGVAERNGVQLVLHDRVKPVDEAVEEIQSVTADEVMEVAAEILSPDKLRLAVIAPEPDKLTDRFRDLVKGRV
jgi:predicted Zn-dependent peptidase